MGDVQVVINKFFLKRGWGREGGFVVKGFYKFLNDSEIFFFGEFSDFYEL